MLYEKNNRPELDRELFRNPTSEYRGAPFWAWNCALEAEEIIRQISIFQQMGMGGYHVHVRTGMSTPYLSDVFMNYVKLALDTGKDREMLTWLYDEDRWPSGAAGGIVTKNHPEYRIRYLMFSPEPYSPDQEQPGAALGSVLFERREQGEKIGVYDVELNADGSLRAYGLWTEGQPVRGSLWYAYVCVGTGDGWFNDQTYLDTLNPDAVKEFARVTHDRYREWFQGDFGGSIPAIFTDEPQFVHKHRLGFAAARTHLILPWTEFLPRTFRDACGCDLVAALPELFWELPEGVSTVRYHYHDHIAERFARAFAGTLGDWCESSGIMLTGHMMLEPTLESQTLALGEAMRSYKSFQLPGIDMLCDWREYNTAKQTQSAVHQYGAPGMLSELYGVTGWDFDFRGHKLQGDWQAALGVTVRVPHLTWMSMKGEAKRDYPACIGYQSPWWDRYYLVEDHFARLNTALTRGKPTVRVAVVHPIESYWLLFGPDEQTAAARANMDRQFAQLTEILLFGLIDFDFLCESQLPELCDRGANPLWVGEMAYDAVIVPPVLTLRSTTVERLEQFQDAGGKLIVLGECPLYVDAKPGNGPEGMYDRASRMALEEVTLLKALEEERFLDIRDEKGIRTGFLLHQLREDNGCKWLFIANGTVPDTHDVDDAPLLTIILRGEYAVEVYDTLTGAVLPCAAEYRDGSTVLRRRWHIHDSLLLRLTPGEAACGAVSQPAAALPKGDPAILLDKVEVSLSEPNAMVLDLAEYSFDGGEFQPTDELLRIDNRCREALGIPLRKKHITQPYLIEKKPTEHTITLRFAVDCECALEAPMLALEDPELSEIALNGQAVPSRDTGWYVDKSIRTVPLPALRPGRNTLTVTVPVGERTNLEWMYLLGDFGVRVDGVQKAVTAPVRRLAFGDMVHQGLPFYTGNVTYHLDVDTGGGIVLRAPVYRGALMEISVDGQKRGQIIYSPYTLELPDLTPGRHRVSITLYGTRQNGFAQLHHTQSVYYYQSPDSWRSRGELWCYEYQLEPQGILKSPEIYPI